MNIYSLQVCYLTKITMPNSDGTGPMGQGPLTGRGGGKCGVVGQGGGYGRGMRGSLCRFGQKGSTPVSLSKEEQKKILQEEKKGIDKMLKELE